jgi:hypothetical protein
MTVERVFPTTAMQAMASAIDDDLTRWNERNGQYHPRMRDVGEAAVQQMSDLIAMIGEMRDQVCDEVLAYDKRRMG